MAATKTTGFRFKPEVLEHLDTLCDIAGMTRTEYLTASIEADFDKYQGEPKLKAFMEQMQVMKKQMLDLMGQMDPNETYQGQLQAKAEEREELIG